MADILIHCCTLRVVRRGGWSWGPSPRSLVEQLVRQIPALLARKLQSLLPADGEEEIAAPVRLRIRIRLQDLMPEDPVSRVHNTAPNGDSSLALEQKMESAIRASLGMNLQPRPSPDSERHRADSHREQPNHLQSTPPVGALYRLLLQWHQHGILEARLFELSEHELEAWHAGLWRSSQLASDAHNVDPNHQEQVEAAIARHLPAHTADSLADKLRRRIILAIEVAGDLRLSAPDAVLLNAVDRVLPPEDVAPPVSSAHSTLAPAAASTDNAFRARSTQIGRTTGLFETWSVHILSALPFLVLNPLRRLGYLELLSAVLESAELHNHSPLFAAALAYKLLTPPGRGWRRDEDSRSAAAAFAGSRDPVREEDLVEFSRRIASHLGPLDRLLAESLAGGHTPGDPVLLCRADTEASSGFIVFDTLGCFPVAIAEDLARLLPILQRLGWPVMVSPDAAGPRVLTALDGAAIGFITDVPPTRSEPWRRLKHGTASLGWSNVPQPHSESMLAAAHDLAIVTSEGTACWDTLAARPAVVHASLPDLDRSLSVAAGVAMGRIAWDLWRAKGRSTPQLALERFCDLDAHVDFSPESVTVRLPLGRRRQELCDNGMLASLGDIPWLAGRRLEFGGG